MTQGRREGFTIVELMLAMAFISILLLSIAMTAIQAGRIYNRGAVLRSLNQSARDIGDTMRRDFLQANRQQIMLNDNEYDPDADDNQIVTSIAEGNLESGRICLGQVSYLWNSAGTLDKISTVGGEDLVDNPAVVKDANGEPINFVRVSDPDGGLCKRNHEDGDRYLSQLAVNQEVTSLLRQPTGGDVVLSIYDLQIVPLVSQGDEGLFRVKYTIGTSKESEINTSDQSCKPPNDNESNFDFCSINNFEMIVRTNG